jgi:hypothetical protein
MVTSWWPWLILMALAGQFVLLQLWSGVQYGDAPRNLHWAMLTAENPAFLIGAPDPYDRIDGFVPDSPELAPRGVVSDHQSRFHPWWGPVPVLLMAGVWWLTGSQTLMTLVVPLAAGGAVLACYGLGSWLFDRRTGLLAAAFVALCPLFYQNAVISYSEAISTLFLLLALWAYLRGQVALTIVLGALTLLCKMDMAVVYGGVIGCSLLYRLYHRVERRLVVQSLLALLVPGLLLMGWYWLRTGVPLPMGTGKGFSLDIFRLVALDMLQGFFFIPWYGSLLTLAVVGVGIVLGLRSPRLTGEQRLILGSWVGLGLFVLLVYMFTPGAGNTPRVILPSLPAVALLAVEGWQRLPRPWVRRVALYMGTLLIITSAFVAYFIVLHRPFLEAHQDLWQFLREQPRGFVLVAEPWSTLWHTGQPVTWFEGDIQFQENILHNREHFARYTEQHPIRYVPVPRPQGVAAIERSTFNVDAKGLYSAEVVAYLREHAQHVALPPYYDLYILPPE